METTLSPLGVTTVYLLPMRFVADPGSIVLGPPSWAFLLFVVLWLPIAAVRQRRRMGVTHAPPSRRRLYVMGLTTQAALLVVSGAVYLYARFPILPAYRLTSRDAGIGVVALAVGLLPMLKPFRLKDPEARRQAGRIAPRTAGERALFYMMALSAGAAEEIAYRGVAFTLVAALVGSWWLSALICAVSFGVVHVFQGWKAASIAGAIGLMAHIVVGLTGTLFVVMVQHALHDIIAGTVIGIRTARSEAANSGGDALAVS